MSEGRTATDADRPPADTGKPDVMPGQIRGAFTGLTVKSVSEATEWLCKHAGFTIVTWPTTPQQTDPRRLGLGFVTEVVTAELRAPNGGNWWLTEFGDSHGKPMQPRISDIGRPSIGLITEYLAADHERLRLAGVRWFTIMPGEIAEGPYAGGWEAYGALTERTPLPKLGISLHQLHPTQKVS